MKSLKYLLLSVLFAILSCVAWPPFDFSFFIFFAWIPLLQLQKATQAKSEKAKFWMYSYIGLLLWNIGTTWWVWNASAGGAVMAIICNALLMSTPLYLFHLVKSKLGKSTGYLALICLWTSFEFIHLRWELTWPWLTLGNVFAKKIAWIQWYEYTGVLGGSLWILLVNILIFESIQSLIGYRQYCISNNIKPHPIRSFLINFKPLTFLLIPIFISVSIFNNYKEQENPVHVTIVQPNIDPYTEKFSGLSTPEQLEKIISLSKQGCDANTQYLVWPETAIPSGIWISNIEHDPSIQMVKEFLKDYPKLKLVTGISAYKKYNNEQEATPTARKFHRGKGYYDAYNTAIQLGLSSDIEIYHKSKLVPGVERMPYPKFFKFLDALAIDMGGISGSLATQEERIAFKGEEINVGPVICYESVFGEFVGEYVQKGANLLFIITNDAWWGNTPGHVQHMHYASLRAIEHRRSFARSANTGISCFINQKGEIINATEYEKDAVIKSTINLNNDVTFYSEHGDFIGRIAACLSVIILVLLFVRTKTEKKIPHA